LWIKEEKKTNNKMQRDVPDLTGIDISVYNSLYWQSTYNYITQQFADLRYASLAGFNNFIGLSVFRTGLSWGAGGQSALNNDGSLTLNNTKTISDSYFTDLEAQIGSAIVSLPTYNKVLSADNNAPTSGVNYVQAFSFTTSSNYKRTITFTTPISVTRTYAFDSTSRSGNLDETHAIRVEVYKNGNLFKTFNSGFTSITQHGSFISSAKGTFSYDCYIGNASGSFTPAVESNSNIYTVLCSYIGGISFSSGLTIVDTTITTNTNVSTLINNNSSVCAVGMTNTPTNYVASMYDTQYVTQQRTNTYSETENLVLDSLTFRNGSGDLALSAVSCDTLSVANSITASSIVANSFGGSVGFMVPGCLCFTSSYGYYIAPVAFYCSTKLLGSAANNAIGWMILMPGYRVRLYTTLSQYSDDTLGYLYENTSANPTAYNFSGTSLNNAAKAVRLWRYDVGTSVWTEVVVVGISS
jgi:hypothetical protein